MRINNSVDLYAYLISDAMTLFQGHRGAENA